MPQYEQLHLLPRLGLARELSDRLYGNYPRRFRELVSNAVDAGASKVEIIIDTDNDFIKIADNGHGMDIETIREEFLSLGGSQKRTQDDKIGRIGVGFLALASLGTLIKIESGSINRNGIRAEIYFDHILDMSARRKPMHEQVIGTIEMINLNRQGTEITISRLRRPTREYFMHQYNDFILQLMRILPLDYNPQSKIFEFLSTDLKKHLLYHEGVYWPSCQVIVNGVELKRYCYGDQNEEKIIALLIIL